jgi:hypothetical protein
MNTIHHLQDDVWQKNGLSGKSSGEEKKRKYTSV